MIGRIASTRPPRRADFALGLGLAIAFRLAAATGALQAAPAPGASAPVQDQTGPTAAAANDQVVQMEALQVVTTPSNGYNTSTATGATRTNTPLIDIPQTVDIATSQMWADQKDIVWNDAFNYLANVEVRNRFAGTGDGVAVRGFQNFTNSTAEDGVLVGDQPFKRDEIGYEQLQVVKGPPSAVQGRAAGTGYFNWILKKPLLTGDFTNISYTYLSNEDGLGGSRATFDTNVLVNASHTAAFRVAGAWQNSKDYLLFDHTAMTDLFPSFHWKIDDKNDLVVTDEIYKDETPSREEGHGAADYPYKDRILFPLFANNPNDPILPLHLPMDFNLGGPGNNDYEKVWFTTVFFTHTFNEHFQYRQVINAGCSSSDQQAFTDENNSTTLIAYGYIHTILEHHSETAQGDFFSKWDWGWIDSNTLLGYNIRDEYNTTTAYKSTPTGPFLTNGLINIAAPGAGEDASFYAGRVVPNVPPATYTYGTAGNFGAYVEQDLGFFHDLIILNGSLRRDHDHSRGLNYLNNTQTSTSDTQLTSYRYGVTIKPRGWIALYGVESQQANPAATYQLYNGLLSGDPRLNNFFTVYPVQKLDEFGIKSELFHGRLSFTADHWELTATGSVINDIQTGVSLAPATYGQTLTFGEETLLQGSETHGYEFESYGAITDRLSLIANYTRMYSSVQNSLNPVGPNGAVNLIALLNDPIWMANAFAKYAFHAPGSNGFEVRAGIKYIGPLWTNATLTTGAVQQYIPHSQYQIDCGFSYVWKRYSYDLMVRNVNDSAFLMMRDSPPRTFYNTISAHF